MNIIRSRIFISASIISLALLLVSATPIPSVDVMLVADNNALDMAELTTTLSKLWAPSVNKLSTRGKETTISPGLHHLLAVSNKIIRAYRNSLPKSVFFHRQSNGQENPVTMEDIEELKRSISKLTDADFGDKYIQLADDAIPFAKLLVSVWPSKEKADAFNHIEACEATMHLKHLPSDNVFHREPRQMIQLLDDFTKESKPNRTDTRWTPLKELDLLVTAIAFLTRQEQGTINKELEDGYKTVKAKIDEWEGKDDKESAQRYLEKWEGLNSLLQERPEESGHRRENSVSRYNCRRETELHPQQTWHSQQQTTTISLK
ncbi:hypothetical protein H0H93_009589 [Arthromyces matolae]|nr:hypothetical protein H0H93_009589 [Arthromyces matolae]